MPVTANSCSDANLSEIKLKLIGDDNNDSETQKVEIQADNLKKGKKKKQNRTPKIKSQQNFSGSKSNEVHLLDEIKFGSISINSFFSDDIISSGDDIRFGPSTFNAPWQHNGHPPSAIMYASPSTRLLIQKWNDAQIKGLTLKL